MLAINGGSILWFIEGITNMRYLLMSSANRVLAFNQYSVNKQVKFLTAFPSSQMSRAKLALTMSWQGNVSNSIYRHL